MKTLDDSHLRFAKCCYRLNLKKWMAFIIGGLVPFLTLALLAWVRSGAVSELRWKLILEKGKENWFHPSRISCDECMYGHSFERTSRTAPVIVSALVCVGCNARNGSWGDLCL